MKRSDEQMMRAVMTMPVVGPAMMAAAVAGKAFLPDEEKDFKAREQGRQILKNAGILTDEGIQLADGSWGAAAGKRPATNPQGLAPSHRNKMFIEHHTDYTNDLDFLAGMGGTTLLRVASGSTDKVIDQLGAELGNAALSNIGHGKELNEETFSKLKANLLVQYSKAGVTSKDTGYQLAKALGEAGKIKRSEQMAIQHTLDLLYDADGYVKAQRLSGGKRGDGVQAILDKGNKAPQDAAKPAEPKGKGLLTREAIIAQNRARYSEA